MKRHPVAGRLWTTRAFRTFILGIAALFAGTATGEAATVTVDFESTHQTWEGFGASSMFYESIMAGMQEPYRTEVFDLIFEDLGANIIGIRPYHDFQPSEGAAYNWRSMANQRTILGAAMERGVVNKIWARISSPPGWMKDNNDYKNGGHVLPQYYDDFATYCRDYVLGMQDTYGFPIYGFSIFNEPGHAHNYETTETTPEEFRDILKIVGADFDSNGLSAVKLFAPDSPMQQIGESIYGNYLAPIVADPVALGYLDVIAVHSYDDKAGNGPWTQSRDIAAAAGRPIWETEDCNLSSAQHNIVGACWGSWWIHRALNLGDVTAWHWWQYFFPHEDTADQGLVDIVSPTSYTVYPRYYMFKQWAKNIPQGAVRVSATSDYADLHVTAFRDAEKVYIVATNYRYQNGAVATAATFNCTSIDGNVQHIRTSAAENYASRPDIVPSGNSFTVQIPALTVNTFIVPAAEVDTTKHPARAADIVITVSDSPESLPDLELSELPGNKTFGITGMWDDGMRQDGGADASTDLRMAQTLQTHGWKGSFAWPLTPMNKAIADTQAILAAGMEICSHSTSHIDMTTLSENRMFWEFASSLVFLGTFADVPVTAYGNPYLKRNTDTDEEFYRSDLLLGRWGGDIGRFSIFDFANRHMCAAFKCGLVSRVVDQITDMIDNGAPGDVLMLWGHVRDNDGWDEAQWTAFEQMLTDYGGRSDMWYATCGEVGSYMFLRNGASLGAADLGANTVTYPLDIGAMPRDVMAIPIGLRISGSQALLDKVTSITVDGAAVPFTSGGGLLTFNVDPFLQDLYPRRITSDILDSAHPTIQNRASTLSAEPSPDLDAEWSFTRRGDAFDVDVSIANNGAVAAESFSFDIACGTLWELGGEVSVPTQLAPSQTFQNTYTLTLKPSVNADGWVAFYGRIDYVRNGEPRTHYLWHDVEWMPSSSGVRQWPGYQ